MLMCWSQTASHVLSMSVGDGKMEVFQLLIRHWVDHHTECCGALQEKGVLKWFYC